MICMQRMGMYDWKQPNIHSPFAGQVVQLQAICAEQLLQSTSLNTFLDYIIAADACCDSEVLDAC